MKHLDVEYTNGVIAAREKYLLKDKIARLCELDAEDAFRALLDSGFGGGAETAIFVHDYEKLIFAEEAKIDEFIREYVPSEAERAYLLSPRDFHNAKALLKAKYLQTSAERMLASEGMLDIQTLASYIENGDYATLKKENAYLATAIQEGAKLLEEEPSGAKLGDIFEKALFSYLGAVSKHRKVLKELLKAKADMTNVLIAVRSQDEESAEDKYLPCGSLKKEELRKLFKEDAEKEFLQTPYADFIKIALQAKSKGIPPMEAERIRDGYDSAYFQAHKYELKKTEPFLYYVYRRRAEAANVRIVFVCLLAGLSEAEIKKRLRTW